MSTQNSPPQNPLGNVPGPANISHEDVKRLPEGPVVAMLVVPRQWTNLVIACVTLLLAVTGIVALMVFINWRNTQVSNQRLYEMNHRMGQIEEKLGVETK